MTRVNRTQVAIVTVLVHSGGTSPEADVTDRIVAEIAGIAADEQWHGGVIESVGGAGVTHAGVVLWQCGRIHTVSAECGAGIVEAL